MHKDIHKVVDKPMDNLVDKLWISVETRINCGYVDKLSQIIHKLYTGISPDSTRLDATYQHIHSHLLLLLLKYKYINNNSII